MNPLVGIVILNYKNYSDTFSCIESVLKINYDSYFIVVVDNKSEDGSAERLQQDFHNKATVHFLLLDKNDGYATGNNRGIELALANGAEYICILNNDTVVNADFLNYMIDFMMKNKEYGIVSPLICDYNNSSLVQSAGAYINLKTGKQKLLLYKENISSVKQGSVLYQPDYLGGACLLVRKNIFEKIGYIPEYYFLFYEETDWCFHARKKGFRLACITDSRIYHKGSATINKEKGLSQYYLTRNSVLFERKYATPWQYVFFIGYTLMAELYSRLIRGRSRCNMRALFLGMFLQIPKSFSFKS